MRNRIGSGALIIIASLLLGAGCATKTRKLVQGFVGANIESCIEQWGKPSSIDTPSDSTTVIYKWHQVYDEGERTEWDPGLHAGRHGQHTIRPEGWVTEQYVYYCDISMVTLRNGSIIDAYYKGNSCP